MITVSRRKALVLLVFAILAYICVLEFPKEDTEVFHFSNTKRIIIDPGHGFPDGGAIGINGSIESTLNLDIALNVQKLLKKKGYSVIMTRSDENALSEEGGTLAERKRKDMYKRLKIINTSDADMFVSIHINKYTDSRSRGAQVIYSANYLQSAQLATSIQEELCLLKNNKTKRTQMKAPDSIFLLKKATIPAVIVECGFSSNFSEEQLLITDEYQNELAGAIVSGIEKYYKNSLETNKGV